MKLLVALWALAGTVSALLPVIVPLNDDANGTQWGPVTADIDFDVGFSSVSRALIYRSGRRLGADGDVVVTRFECSQIKLGTR